VKVDVARGEAVEKELDQFIDRRAAQNGRQRAEEMAWKASVRSHLDRERRQNRAAWFAHYCQMAERHARISEDYERRAEELCKEGAA
jgi:hypothetical protein